MYYLFDTCGFYYGMFTSREDALEALEGCEGEFFITTQEDPWEMEDALEIFEKSN